MSKIKTFGTQIRWVGFRAVSSPHTRSNGPNSCPFGSSIVLEIDPFFEIQEPHWGAAVSAFLCAIRAGGIDEEDFYTGRIPEDFGTIFAYEV